MKRLLFLLSVCFYLGAITSPVLAERNDAETVTQGMTLAIAGYVAEALSVDVSEVYVEGLTAMNGQKRIHSGKVLKIRAANSRRFLGRAIFIVRTEGAGNSSLEQWVSADVSQIVEVVVASRKLRRLDVVQAGDVHIQPIRLRRVDNRYLSDAKEVLGKRLTQSLRKGHPIREDQLELAPLVRRGDRVTITVRSQGLQIVTSGKAKQDGQLGEIIRVMNLDSKKTVFAEVMDSGDVQIVFKSKD